MTRPLTASEPSLQAEYGQALESWRGQITTSVQIVLGLAAVDAAMLGVAIESRNAWLILSGAILCMIVFIALGKGEFDIRLSVVRALQIERELGIKAGLAARWFVASYGASDFEKVVEATERPIDEVERARAIRPAFVVRHYRWVILIAGLVQAILSVVLGVSFDWWQTGSVPAVSP